MKRYPFSLQKHGHDIELRLNRVMNERDDLLMSGASISDELFNKMEALIEELESLLDAVLNSRDGRISYLTGPQIGLAKETVAWAANTRADTQRR